MTKTLVIVHAGLATATETPELVIAQEEGELIAQAAVNVMAEFDIAPDPKTQAIIGFIMACGIVYGPRAVMIRARKEQEKREKAANGGAGTAGMYDAAGQPLGTTEFSTTQ